MENGEREGGGKKVKEKSKKEKQREGELYAERGRGAAQKGVRVSVVERLVKFDKQDTGTRREVPCE